MAYRRPLSLVLLALSFFLFGLVLVLEATDCEFLFNSSDPQPARAYGTLMVPLNALAFSVMGTLVVSRQPGNRYGWVMLLFGLGINLFILTGAYGACSVLGLEPLPYGVETLWLDSVVSTFIFFGGLLLLLALYPDGRFLSPRWRRFGLLLLALNLFLAFTRALIPGTIGESNLQVSAENPFGADRLAAPEIAATATMASNGLFVLILLTGIVSLLLRYRSAKGVTKLQIKWFLFFAATAGVLFVAVEVIGNTIYPPIFEGWFYLVELSFFWIGFPLVIGFAILRYRLFDIDIIIRRTLVYGMLTAVLVTIYFGVVLLAQSAFVAITGQESPIAVVISTLVIAALFNPLRKRVQAFIDRRFYRSSYDAAQALAQFAQTARDEVEMDRLLAGLSGVINETMQPEQLSLWLRSQSDRYSIEDSYG